MWILQGFPLCVPKQNTRHNDNLILMYNSQYHQEKKVELLLYKSLYKCTTDSIWVNKERFPKKQKINVYFKGIKEIL